jgi:hypothetical protein
MFFGAGWLADHPVAEGDEQPPRGPAKRKLEAGADTDPAAAVPGEDSWRVCCLDGASFWVEVPEGAGVPGMKRAIGAVRDVPHDAMELFVEGQEEPLGDSTRLLPADKVPVFMLPKQVTTDRQALEALFTSCGGANWERNSGWMTGADLSTWHGVTVDAEGRVITLKLQGNNLCGPAPAELGKLTALRAGDFAGNHLTGPVPAEVGHLRALTVLRLSYNNLTGRVPAALGELPALKLLCLDHNPQLSGQEATRHRLQTTCPGCHVDTTYNLTVAD